MAAIAALYLANLVDARTPLLVADDLGVRIRLGTSGAGCPGTPSTGSSCSRAAGCCTTAGCCSPRTAWPGPSTGSTPAAAAPRP